MRLELGVNHKYFTLISTLISHMFPWSKVTLCCLLLLLQNLFNDVVGAFASGKSGQPPLVFQFCEYLNVSICPATETDSVSSNIHVVEMCEVM